MASWTDRHGDAHEVLITLAVAKRLARETSLDLLDARRNQDSVHGLMSQLADDELRIQCLAVVHGADDMEAFWGLFDADAMDSAELALLEAIVDFFPARTRQILTRLLQRTQAEAEAMANEAAASAMEEISELDIRSALKKSMTDGSSSSASSASSVAAMT